MQIYWFLDIIIKHLGRTSKHVYMKGGIVVFFWVVGFILKIGGGLIHMLLVLAVIVFLVDKISGKR
ncbi:lmo0937 family membrane protein [Clostridium estertheticum]|uniref:lmo0937 family membrane protein n=1 Tax=Clostridium estertheticum TaxID=238834 RepID=UPI00217DEE72|nr:lmo0937 family membrane protein [Clostridium estertheticum]